jgi:putative ABC transport system permease protein
MNSIGFLETIWRDVLYALRTMRKNSAFALTAVFTLALGIGGDTALFTVIRTVLLKPLEYRDPDRLVRISVNVPLPQQQELSLSLQRFEEMRKAARSFSELGAVGRPENMALSGSGDPEALKVARVSANFLSVLGVEPILGRSFLPEEDTRGGRPVAILSAGLWKRRFGADPLVAGKTATLDAMPYTIIGVLPAGFAFPFAGPDVWVTRPSEWSALPSRYWSNVAILTGFARLKPQVSLEQARAELNVLHRQYNAAHPGRGASDPGASMRVVWLRDQVVANVRPMLWMLFGAVGFVLLIACANVASLLLARATTRSREFAVRAALGAARGRLIRQLLAESLVLATLGGALGVLLAQWGLRAITRVSALPLPRAGEIRLDGMVLGFTVALSIATGVLFGLFPTLAMSRPDLAGVLRESGAAAGRGLSSRRSLFGINARGLLVVAQVALSIVLLIGAALLMQSFARLHSVDPGFQPANLLTMKIALPIARYDTDQKRAAFFEELVRRVEVTPGVRAVTVALRLPTTTRIGTDIHIAGRPDQDAEPQIVPNLQSITPGYLRTLGIALRRGRAFTARDNTPGSLPVVMINEGLARRFWPDYPRGQDPVGQHISTGFDKAIGWMEIVGIMADVNDHGLAFDAESAVYLPTALHPPQVAYLAARTEGDPRRFVHTIRSQVLAIDADQPVSEVRTMDEVIDASIGQRRLTMLLLGVFAGVALLLAMVGIYGVIAYSVAQRTQEVGIRRALGAQPGDILRLVLRQALGLALAGVAIGIGGALAVTRVMKGLLFQVSATDPATYIGIGLLFIVVASAASYIPARRATRIDPMAALRVG